MSPQREHTARRQGATGTSCFRQDFILIQERFVGGVSLVWFSFGFGGILL